MNGDGEVGSSVCAPAFYFLYILFLMLPIFFDKETCLMYFLDALSQDDLLGLSLSGLEKQGGFKTMLRVS